MTEVIHIRFAPKDWMNNPNYVYIGRSGKGLDGYFGNPFKSSSGKKHGSTLDFFRGYVVDKLDTDEEYYRRVKDLRGKILVCFCKPNPCHGDILAEYAERLWLNDI